MADSWLALTIVHLAATAAMAGVLAVVHFVHYPSFPFVDSGTYPEFQQLHMRRILRVLLVPWITELATAAWLVVVAPTGELRALAVAGAALAAGTVAVTGLGAAPVHGRLLSGFDADDHRRLMRADLARTVLWLARVPVAVAIVWRSVT